MWGLHVAVLHAPHRATPGVFELGTSHFFRPRGRREGLAEQEKLLEIVTYGFAAHQRAQHIEVVGVGHVPHPRGHPPAEGGVHEFNKLFVERKVIQKLGKKSPKLWFNSSKYLRFIWFNSRK